MKRQRPKRTDLENLKAASARYRSRHPDRVREYGLRYRLAHPERRKQSIRKWREKNRQQIRRQRFERGLRDVHGITVEDWARMFHSQGGRCAGCLDPLRDGWGTAVDHCHRTDKVRGLLCIRCNRSLGVLRERPETLRRLADYIERHAP